MLAPGHLLSDALILLHRIGWPPATLSQSFMSDESDITAWDAQSGIG